jgi:hypothetical protein
MFNKIRITPLPGPIMPFDTQYAPVSTNNIHNNELAVNEKGPDFRNIPPHFPLAK